MHAGRLRYMYAYGDLAERTEHDYDFAIQDAVRHVSILRLLRHGQRSRLVESSQTGSLSGGCGSLGDRTG